MSTATPRGARLGQLEPEKCFSNHEMNPAGAQLRAEAALLASFAAFLVAFPRSSTKRNSALYAQQIISSVRTFYEDKIGRRPRLLPNGRAHGHLKAAMKGLRAIAPVRAKRRLQILQYHLRAVKRVLDLCNNQFHRVLCCMWLMQWQGCMRASDIIRRKREGARCWAPERDTHRGRIKVGIARGTDGRPIGASITLMMKPTKTDRSVEKGLCRLFILDEDEAALSAARAMREMLRGDPPAGCPEDISLLIDPRGGKELRYEDSVSELKEALVKAGFCEHATRLHSLRVGGAAEYANSNEVGELVARSVGALTSDSKW